MDNPANDEIIIKPDTHNINLYEISSTLAGKRLTQLLLNE